MKGAAKKTPSQGTPSRAAPDLPGAGGRGMSVWLQRSRPFTFPYCAAPKWTRT